MIEEGEYHTMECPVCGAPLVYVVRYAPQFCAYCGSVIGGGVDFNGEYCMAELVIDEEGFVRYQRCICCTQGYCRFRTQSDEYRVI